MNHHSSAERVERPEAMSQAETDRHDLLMRDARDWSKNSRDRAERLLEMLSVESGSWAERLLHDAMVAGLLAYFKKWLARQTRTVAVKCWDGTIVKKKRIHGARSPRNAEGKRFWQQPLWVEMTWQQVDEILVQSRAGQMAYAVTAFQAERLLVLRELHPDAQTVALALKAQGCSLDEWLAS